MPVVQAELHRMAHRCMRGEAAGHTLQTTALVNEAYLRLVDLNRVQWQDRVHFFAMSARLMRRILVDFARARRAHKRGDGAHKVDLDDALLVSEDACNRVAELDDALEALAAIDERKCRVVECRFFGGLTNEETAEALHVSPETVMRDWKMARAWLSRELKGSTRADS
jgi:RNA polymerase sigma factor (TIGR02999 family)